MSPQFPIPDGRVVHTYAIRATAPEPNQVIFSATLLSVVPEPIAAVWNGIQSGGKGDVSAIPFTTAWGTHFFVL
jgi:hypothetical protein